MKVLGLDVATKTGWATMENNRVIESGVEDFALKRGESPGMKFLRFRVWIEDLIKMTDPELIVYEMAHYRGGAATECCVGLITRVQEMAANYRKEYTSVHSGTLKKFVTGQGKGDKSAMKAAIEQKFGIRVIDDNHADAIALCWYAVSEIAK